MFFQNITFLYTSVIDFGESAAKKLTIHRFIQAKMLQLFDYFSGPEQSVRRS